MQWGNAMRLLACRCPSFSFYVFWNDEEFLIIFSPVETSVSKFTLSGMGARFCSLMLALFRSQKASLPHQLYEFGAPSRLAPILMRFLVHYPKNPAAGFLTCSSWRIADAVVGCGYISSNPVRWLPSVHIFPKFSHWIGIRIFDMVFFTKDWIGIHSFDVVLFGTLLTAAVQRAVICEDVLLYSSITVVLF